MSTGRMVSTDEHLNKIVISHGRGFKTMSRVSAVSAKHRVVIGGKRKSITVWTSASRRRFRDTLLWAQFPQGWVTAGLTFTIPGECSHGDAKRLWSDFCDRVNKAGWCMIWRLEIQDRGVLHWHAIGASPLDHSPAVHVFNWWDMWHDAIRRMGPILYTNKAGTPAQLNNRMEIPGSHLHSCDVQIDGVGELKQGAWMRYLQDHASKTKQAQVAVGVGRHWGVVGRRHIGRSEPSAIYDLTDRQYFNVLRRLQRLATSSHPDSSAPFGRKLNARLKRGHRGTATWFTRPEIVQRLIPWAIAITAAAPY